MQAKIKFSTNKKNILTRILLWFLVIAFFLLNGAGLFIGNIIYEETSVLHLHLHDQDMPLLENIRKEKNGEDIILQSAFGYPLQGTYIPNPQATDKTLIFLHGFTENRAAGLSFADIYLKAGFNLLLVDSRAHGDSGGGSVTWGRYEKYDLEQWISWVAQKFPAGMIGVHGKSMGAATALLHAELNETDKRVAFYIADSSYSDFEKLLALKIKKQLQLQGTALPALLLQYANVIAYFNSGFTFHQSSPLRAVRTVTTPILYIHGEDDSLIPVSMSTELYDNTKGPRQIQLFPHTEHATAIFNDRAAYAQLVQTFINSVE